ncbi:ABC transporter [Boletus reticuloceps]|uniref:ABC transporter n=1 Tax=Boletus reticuloceps TaxID=495285 RepID=A0A8I2YHN9_9AGAM|nr:ABC transporter [Boletus reticuloceps]
MESRLLSGRPLVVIVFALLLSIVLIALDQTIVATALPVIVSDFNALQDVTWVTAGYVLTIVAFTPMYGQALTVFPTKWVYMIAIVIFEMGSLFCGTAPMVHFLIFGRIFAGIGAAGICVSVLTIIAESTEIRYRAIVFAAIGALFNLSSIVGPLLGGAFTTHLSWRWCFYINLPLGALACLVIILKLPLHKPLTGAAERATIKGFVDMDWIGCSLSIAAMVVLLLSLSRGSSNGWNSPVVITLLCVCILLLTCLFLWERHQGDRGILPLTVIACRSKIGACIVVFFTMFNTLAFIFYIPLLYQAVYGHSPFHSAIDMLPFVLSSVIATASSALILSRTGHYWSILICGPVFCCVSGGLFFTVTENTSSTKLIIYQILYGIGTGATMQNTFVALQALSKPETMSISNGIATVMQMLGGFIGVTIAGVVFDAQLRQNLAVYAPNVDPGPITASVAAIYSDVTSTARPSVIHAYVKSVGALVTFYLYGRWS